MLRPMKGWLRAFLILCCASLTLPSLARPPGVPAAGRFIALSDIHFDPMASGIAQRLADAPPESWAELLDHARKAYGGYGRDTPWPLLRSALDQMQAAEPDPAFLILTGDVLAHRFRARFGASGVRDRGPAAYRAFVEKTVAFVGREIARRFPGKRVFIALGNDDDDCGDYRLAPGGPFLHDMLPLARGLLGLPEGIAFDEDWLSGRGYDVPNGAVPGLRMVFLNSVFLSREYRQGCGPRHETDPGLDALDWLERRLAASARSGEKVWLVLHIPPGADAYATLQAGACPDRLLQMWKPDYLRRFLALAQRYRSTIAASFSGHIHMDEFRLVGEDGRHDGFVLGTPGISPIFGQNPGFHVYSYGAAGELQDRRTWYLANLSQAGSSVGPRWRLEYEFQRFWGLPAINLAALDALNDRILEDEQDRARWFSAYRVGRTAAWHVPDGVESLPPKVFRAYYCAIGHVDPDGYRRCLCGDGLR